MGRGLSKGVIFESVIFHRKFNIVIIIVRISIVLLFSFTWGLDHPTINGKYGLSKYVITRIITFVVVQSPRASGVTCPLYRCTLALAWWWWCWCPLRPASLCYGVPLLLPLPGPFYYWLVGWCPLLPGVRVVSWGVGSGR